VIEVSILPLEAPMSECGSAILPPRSYRLLQCHMTSTRDSCLSMCFCARWQYDWIAQW